MSMQNRDDPGRYASSASKAIKRVFAGIEEMGDGAYARALTNLLKSKTTYVTADGGCLLGDRLGRDTPVRSDLIQAPVDDFNLAFWSHEAGIPAMEQATGNRNFVAHRRLVSVIGLTSLEKARYWGSLLRWPLGRFMTERQQTGTLILPYSDMSDTEHAGVGWSIPWCGAVVWDGEESKLIDDESLDDLHRAMAQQGDKHSVTPWTLLIAGAVGASAFKEMGSERISDMITQDCTLETSAVLDVMVALQCQGILVEGSGRTKSLRLDPELPESGLLNLVGGGVKHDGQQVTVEPLRIVAADGCGR